MKRLIVLACATALLAVPAANAAAPKGPTLAQFKALQAQVKKDEKRIKDLENFASGASLLIGCTNALAADAFEGTWQEIDALAVSLGKPAIFGPQTAISDAQGCSAFTIARSQALPPTVAAFSAVARLLSGSAF